MTIDHEWMCQFTFTDDGRFSDRDGDDGDWRITENTLTLAYDDYAPITLAFRLLGTARLNLTGDGIEVMLHRR